MDNAKSIVFHVVLSFSARLLLDQNCYIVMDLGFSFPFTIFSSSFMHTYKILFMLITAMNSGIRNEHVKRFLLMSPKNSFFASF